MKIHISILFAFGCTLLFGQASVVNPTNSASSTSDFLGWQFGVPDILKIEHKGTEDIDISISTGDGIYFENGGTIGIGDYDVSIPTIGNIEVNLGSTVLNRAGTSLFMDCQNQPFQAVGALFNLFTNSNNFGIVSNIFADAGSTDNQTGVWGIACSPNSQAIAVFGEAQTGTNNFAAYFDGQIAHTSLNFGPSDENLKINIEDIEGMNEALEGIEVVTYNYLPESLAHLALPSSNQIGVLAQNVYDIFPELTKTVDVRPRPGSEDDFSLQEYLAVRYGEFVPMLIAAYKERTQLINEQQSRIEEVQAQIYALTIMLEEL